MPRPTAQELHEAKKRKQEEQQRAEAAAEAEAKRQAQESAERKRRMEELQERYDILITVANSLYEEIDKLTKKAPAERLTDLSLRKVNELITDTKEFLPDDAYLKGITIFEAAGDNPEYRDALLILGQVRAALKRFRARQQATFSRF